MNLCYALGIIMKSIITLECLKNKASYIKINKH